MDDSYEPSDWCSFHEAWRNYHGDTDSDGNDIEVPEDRCTEADEGPDGKGVGCVFPEVS